MVSLSYWLSEHPSVVGFQWSLALWGSTWSFLITSISFYILTAVALHLLLLLFSGRRPVPIGRLPALHSLALSLVSFGIFLGILSSAAAEIRETRWIWRRSKTPFQWLLCFPIGTRPSGRVFFWSYAFYLSRFLHVLRTYLAVLAILFTTLGFAVVNAYRVCTELGLRPARFPFVMNCHLVFLLCNSACHVGVLLLHFWKGGCNGFGAWVFNSALNTFALVLFLRSYVKARMIRRKAMASMAAREEDERESMALRTKNKPLTSKEL
nr:elongation of fatty acids protein 3-like [Ipomoea batatas]